MNGIPIDPDAPLSVVIIAFNQERYLSQAIESVLGQSALDRIREIVVVDDASTDRSFEIASRFAGLDPRLRAVRHEKNSGGCAAPRNTGLRYCSAPYAAFLDGDDLWMPHKAARNLELLERSPGIGLLFSDYIAFDDGGRYSRVIRTRSYRAGERNQLARFFVQGGPVAPSTAVVSRAALDQVGVFDPSMAFNEDSELWNRIASVAPIQHIRAPLVRKREWFGSLGSAKYARENLACKEEITRRMLDRVPALARVAERRQAEIAFKHGLLDLDRGDRRSAARRFGEAFRRDPWHLKALIYRAVIGLPGTPQVYLGAGRRLRALLLGQLP